MSSDKITSACDVPHISCCRCRLLQTADRSGSPKYGIDFFIQLHAPAGLLAACLEWEKKRGAVQQAPQPERQYIRFLLRRRSGSADHKTGKSNIPAIPNDCFIEGFIDAGKLSANRGGTLHRTRNLAKNALAGALDNNKVPFFILFLRMFPGTPQFPLAEMAGTGSLSNLFDRMHVSLFSLILESTR